MKIGEVAFLLQKGERAEVPGDMSGTNLLAAASRLASAARLKPAFCKFQALKQFLHPSTLWLVSGTCFIRYLKR